MIYVNSSTTLVTIATNPKSDIVIAEAKKSLSVAAEGNCYLCVFRWWRWISPLRV